MSALRRYFRERADGSVAFWCPACGTSHAIKFGEGGWAYDGNLEAPTVTPSVNVSSGHFVDGHKRGDRCWCTYNEEHPGEKAPYVCERCHLNITKGTILYHGDSTHALAGKTVPLPEYP